MINGYVEHIKNLKTIVDETNTQVSALEEKFQKFKQIQSELITRNVFERIDSLFNKLFESHNIFLIKNLGKSFKHVENLTNSLNFLGAQKKIKELKQNQDLLKKNLNKVGISFIEGNPSCSINSKNSILSYSNWLEIIEDLKKGILIRKNKESYESIWNKIRRINGNLRLDSKNINSEWSNSNKDLPLAKIENRSNKEMSVNNIRDSEDSRQNLLSKHSVIPQKKEKEKDTGFDNYEYYFSLDQRELDRIKRSGKYRKKSRKSKYKSQ